MHSRCVGLEQALGINICSQDMESRLAQTLLVKMLGMVSASTRESVLDRLDGVKPDIPRMVDSRESDGETRRSESPAVSTSPEPQPAQLSISLPEPPESVIVESVAPSPASSVQTNTAYTADDYLSTCKLYTPAKKLFRVNYSPILIILFSLLAFLHLQQALKRAAQECMVWGVKVMRELTKEELCHIHKEVSAIIVQALV